MANQALRHATRPQAPTPAAASEGLSPRECEVLHWCAQGKTSWEIARILEISERTVNYHLYQAAEKLGTRGRRATCVRALLTGQIAA